MSANEYRARLENVEKRILAACQRAGRDRDDVKLLAVSKKQSLEKIQEAIDCGVQVFGENRVQEARAKIPRFSAQLNWHLIGHLQRNKVKYVLNLFQMIHSVDSPRLLHEIEKRAGNTMPVLLQVNVSGEGAKFGLEPSQTAELIETANEMRHVEVHGLMTMPPFSKDPEKVRVHFANLRKLRDQLEEETRTLLPELSMGMSHDFEVAIEEGATWVRLGSCLFGPRNS